MKPIIEAIAFVIGQIRSDSRETGRFSLCLPMLSKSKLAIAPVMKSGILIKSSYHSSEFEFAVVKENEIFLFTISISVT